MAFNPVGAKQVSLSIFGGQVSEMSPPDLPEGVSPACNDVIFSPGTVGSRPGLHKVFTNALPAGGPSNVVPTVVYGKSFVMPNGSIENLYLDSNGILWWEDPINSPGTYTQFGTVAAPSLAKSCTAFGKEYLAISDGLHGTEPPLQWDGTHLDRVTQDGPGAPPAVASIALPAVNMQASGSSVLTLTESDPGGGVPFTTINTWTANSVAAINPGDSLTIAGYTGASAAMNGTWTVLQIFTGGSGGYANLLVLSAYLPAGTVFSTGAATGTVSTGTLVRQGNTVTCTTASAHQMLPGYQAQIAGITATSVGGGVATIVIANENTPGVAIVTTNSAHGLLPNTYISLTGVNATVAGTSISSIARAGQVVTVTTSSPHNLSPGAVVTIAGVTLASFNSTAQVATVNSSTVFTFIQVDVDASSSGGTVSINWPIPDTPTPTYFEVLSCPTPTTFEISIAYSDGTWSSGTVTYAWNGTYIVTAVPTATSFQYQQYGPNANSNTVGTVTPTGQAAPGIHQCQMSFLTRQDAITRPSPPVQFVANGGQYISVSNMAIGPPNVIARILEFTSAEGAYFFYIPVPAQVNGQVVSTATQINDNVTTSVLLDFSDATLLAATGVSIPGNDIAAQIILDGALGFAYYASRLITWGQRNTIQNLLGMSFDGGYVYNTNLPNNGAGLPSGWTMSAANLGQVTAGHFGEGFQVSGAGSAAQSFYQDARGAPIGTGNGTTYSFRAWISGGTSVTATISSASTSFSSSVTLNSPATAAFVQGNFSAAMPTTIPSDMILTITWSGTPLIDEMSIIYAQNPWTDADLLGSYDDNPEAFDGVTGVFGSSQDAHKVMDCATLRETLYWLTQEPGGRLHQTNDNGITEPVGWTVTQVGANCGLLSAFALTKSQADDSSASGGEEFFAWASSSGARIFGGDQPWKLSQEIQPDWVGAAKAGAASWSSAPGINPAYQTRCWALNDPVGRVIYFGVTLTGPPQGAANRIFVLDYRELETAYAIGNSPPVHTSFSGRLIVTDHTRKWAPWNLTVNGAALMYRGAGSTQPVFFSGNGLAIGSEPGSGQVYTLDPAKLTDDDYGQIYPSYVTYMFIGHDAEVALQLDGGRKLLAYMAIFASGFGQLTITPLCDALSNPWPLTGIRPLSSAPTHDMEWGGGNAQAQRMALQFASSPLTGTDNSFSLQHVITWWRKARLAVRGAM